MWYDPQHTQDDEAFYGFTASRRRALNANLDNARRTDRDREREREVRRPCPLYPDWLTSSKFDLDLDQVPVASGGGRSSQPGTLPAVSRPTEAGTGKPYTVDRPSEANQFWGDWVPRDVLPSPSPKAAVNRDRANHPGPCVHGCGVVTWRHDPGGYYCCIDCAKFGAPQDTDMTRLERSRGLPRPSKSSPRMCIEDLPFAAEGWRHCVQIVADCLGGFPSKWRRQSCSATELVCASKSMHTWFHATFDAPFPTEDLRGALQGTAATRLALLNFNAAHPPGRIIIRNRSEAEEGRVSTPMAIRFRPAFAYQEVGKLRSVWETVVDDEAVRAHLNQLAAESPAESTIRRGGELANPLIPWRKSGRCGPGKVHDA